jgi:hypothetical protein
VEQEQRGAREGGGRGGRGSGDGRGPVRAPQQQIQDRAAGEVDEEAGQPEGTRLQSPQVRIQKERGEKDGARLIGGVAVPERLGEGRPGMDHAVVLDAGVLVEGERGVGGRQAAQERRDENERDGQAVGETARVAQRGSGRIWGTFLM